MIDRQDVIRQLRSHRSDLAVPEGALLPDYTTYSIASIPRLVQAALGCGEAASADWIPETGARHVVLVIFDGLGYQKLSALLAEQAVPTLARLSSLGTFIPLTTVFPSTTVAALATYATGRTPMEHGLLGYRLYLRETATITNMIQLTALGQNDAGGVGELGLDLDRFLGTETVYGRLARSGVVTHTLLPQYIATSGLSTLLYRGSSTIRGCVSWTDMLVAARELLRSASAPTLVMLYWPTLDTIAHVRGPDTDPYTAEAVALDQALGRELVGQADDTLLVISSDHGFVSMAPTDYVPLESLPPLASRCLLPPLGEPRASYLYTKDAAPIDTLDDLDGLGLWCVPSQQALDSGLLGSGTPHPEARYRIGDLIVASLGSAGIDHPYNGSKHLLGMHGGLTESEMLVPLIVAPL